MSGGIQEIRVRNYQSLRKADIKLGAITAIVGPTDSGKSAFFRAVKAVVENQDGTEFITAGEKKTVVTIDGVAWIQSEKDNEYRIGEKVWQRVGRGVPDEVRAELGMGMQEFGKDVKVLLNFAGQLDRAFLVEGNPADSAKIVGAISNVHKIYNALREAEKDTKATKRTIGEETTRLEALRLELLDSGTRLGRYAQMANALESVFKQARESERQLEAILDARQRWSKIEQTIEAERNAIRRTESIKTDELLKICEQAATLTDALGKLRAVTGAITAAKRALVALQGVELDGWADMLTGLETLQRANKTLVQVLVELGDCRKQESGYGTEVERLKGMLSKIDACETCGAAKKDWRLNV